MPLGLAGWCLLAGQLRRSVHVACAGYGVGGNLQGSGQQGRSQYQKNEKSHFVLLAYIYLSAKRAETLGFFSFLFEAPWG